MNAIWSRMKRQSLAKEPTMLDLIKRYDIEIAVAVIVIISYTIGWCVRKYDELSD